MITFHMKYAYLPSLVILRDILKLLTFNDNVMRNCHINYVMNMFVHNYPLQLLLGTQWLYHWKSNKLASN